MQETPLNLFNTHRREASRGLSQPITGLVYPDVS